MRHHGSLASVATMICRSTTPVARNTLQGRFTHPFDYRLEAKYAPSPFDDRPSECGFVKVRPLRRGHILPHGRPALTTLLRESIALPKQIAGSAISNGVRWRAETNCRYGGD